MKFKTQKDAQSYMEFIGEGYVCYSLKDHCWLVKT